MMWVSRQKGQLNLRHNCDQGDPNIVYSWLHHDGSTFGEQEIIDTGEAHSVRPYRTIYRPCANNCTFNVQSVCIMHTVYT